MGAWCTCMYGTGLQNDAEDTCVQVGGVFVATKTCMIGCYVRGSTTPRTAVFIDAHECLCSTTDDTQASSCSTAETCAHMLMYDTNARRQQLQRLEVEAHRVAHRTGSSSSANSEPARHSGGENESQKNSISERCCIHTHTHTCMHVSKVLFLVCAWCDPMCPSV